MSNGLVNENTLNDIANAINVLNGTDGEYYPSEMADEILDAIPDIEVTDSIVSVTDAAAYPAEELEFSVEPVQDLHGYDAPWPAGGGKNLLPTFDTAPTVEGLTIIVNNGAVTINGTISTATTVNAPTGTWKWDGSTDCWLSGCPSGGSATSRYSLRVSDTEVSSGFSAYDVGSGIRLDKYSNASTITNRPLMFSIVLRAGTYTNLTFRPMLNYGLSAEPYAPYSNICPISGWTAVNGERTGKNLVFGKIERSNINANGAIQQGNSYDLHIAEVKIGKTYCITTQDTGAIYGFFTAMPAQGSVSYNGERIVTEIMYFTAPITGYVVFRSSNGYATPQLELGSTATSYELYQGTSIPVSFPAAAGTVYGGKVDVINGKLTAYPEYDSYNGETLTGEWISDRDAYVAGTTPTIGAQVVDLSGVGTEYDLTPQQVQMLLGDNNIWCDTGDTSLKYKVDLSRYIAKSQAAQATPQLSLSRQAVSNSASVSTDRADELIEESEEAEKLPVDDVKSVDAAEDEPAESPVEEDTEEPIERNDMR